MLNYAQVLSVTHSKSHSNKAVSKSSHFSMKRGGQTKEDLAICVSRRSLIVFSVFNWILPSEHSLQMIIICNQMANLCSSVHLFFHS